MEPEDLAEAVQKYEADMKARAEAKTSRASLRTSDFWLYEDGGAEDRMTQRLSEAPEEFSLDFPSEGRTGGRHQSGDVSTYGRGIVSFLTMLSDRSFFAEFSAGVVAFGGRIDWAVQHAPNTCARAEA